jgi:hypothetical protein
MAGRHRVVHGRHRKPVPPRTAGATVARTALAGTALVAPFGVQLLGAPVAEAAAVRPASGWGAIVHCESGGNPRASNGTHFGLFQFDLPTWRSVNGPGHPLNASPAQQIAAAERLFARRGTQPWAASQSCWSGVTRALTIRSGPARVVAGATKPRAVPKPRVVVKPKPKVHVAPKLTPKPHPAPRVTSRRLTPAPPPKLHSHRVIRGDTLSEIAARNRVPQRALHGFRSGNPNLIFPGEIVTWRK